MDDDSFLGFLGIALPLIPVFIVIGTLFLLLDEKAYNTPDATSFSAGDKDGNETNMAGHKSVCEKCGVKVSINYGDSNHTLCKKCS